MASREKSQGGTGAVESSERIESALASALAQFDRVAANLDKLESIWKQLSNLTPDNVVFGLDTPVLENLVRAFVRIAEQLPAIDGFQITAKPMSQDEIAQSRLDAWEIGEIEAKVFVERAIEEPGRELAKYRFKIDRARSSLVRNHVLDVMDKIDTVIGDVVASEGVGRWRTEDRWDELAGFVSELDRLVGNMVPGQARWNDLRRHLRFAQANDLTDIAAMDWPSVRAEVEANLYDDLEPIPVAVDDLGELVRSRPIGPVSTQLDWSILADEDFERLVFELVRQTPGYENVNWLMKTHAADRGRDIEAYRVVNDALAGVRRYRILIQCKHWLQRSVGRKELIECIESVKLWEPPLIDVVVVATTGRFSQDAVAVAEKRNHQREVPGVELWPDSHLETLLSRRPALVASFRLR